MSFILNSTSIRRPNEITETSNKQYAQQKALDGTVSRDYFGEVKKVWILTYRNINPTDYNTIKTIYDNYYATDTAQSWEVTESNYTVSATYVHINLDERSFKTAGTSYLSDFKLILTEA